LALTSPEKKQVALGFFLATAFKRASVVAILGAIRKEKTRFCFFFPLIAGPTPARQCDSATPG
jgi:hypothetical protein